MTVVLGELYTALIDAGVPPDKAEKAVREVMDHARGSIMPARMERDPLLWLLMPFIPVLAILILVLYLMGYYIAGIHGTLQAQSKEVARLATAVSELPDRLRPRP